MAKYDYIPKSDSDFDRWIHNFVNFLNANLAALGLTAEDVAPLNTKVARWDIAYPSHTTAQAAAQGARQEKDNTRSGLTGEVRPLVGQLQPRTNVTDRQRESLGITVRSTTKTAPSAPSSRPAGQVETNQRLQHTISFWDESTQNSRAKPPRVVGCEIWMKVGDPAPIDSSEMSYVAMSTRTPHVIRFDGAHAGKNAYYMLRWVNRRGDRGPWSGTISGTITN